MTDAAIHRVLKDGGGQCGSFLESQWIATVLRPRDDKNGQECVVVYFVCHCEEDRMDDAAIQRFPGNTGGFYPFGL